MNGLKFLLSLVIMLCASPSRADITTWFNGTRAAAIDNSALRLTSSLDQGRISELLNLGTGANAFASGTVGGLTFHVCSSLGTWYYSVKEPANTTYFRVHEAGKDYFRVEVSPIVLKASNGSVSPIQVVLNLHVWSDRVYGEAIFKNTGASTVSLKKMEIMTTFDAIRFNKFKPMGGGEQAIPTGTFALNYPGNNMPATGFTLLHSSPSSNGSVAYIIGKTSNTRHLSLNYGTYGLQTSNAIICLQTIWDNLKDGGNLSMPPQAGVPACFQLFASTDNTASTGDNEIECEANLLTPSVLASSVGWASYDGYDGIRGCYQLTEPAENGVHGNGYRFSHRYQNYYEWAKVQLPSSSRARHNRFRFVKGEGNWGSGVIADEWGIPRGETVTCTRGLNSYTVLDTAANAGVTFVHKGVFKRWGENPCFMTSTEDPYGGWWDNSVNGISGGFSHNWDTYRIFCGASTVCDVGAIDGNPKNKDQSSEFPENTGGWEFLKYMPLNGTWNTLRMRGFKYNRLSPNLVDRTYSAESPDAKIDATIRIINFPFSHLTRQFIHLRYDVRQTVDFGSSGYGLQDRLRLFSMGDEAYGQSSFSNFAYQDWNGVHSSAWSAVTDFIMGNPYADPIPWVCEYGGAIVGNRGMIIRDFSCRVDGQYDYNPAFTLRNVNGSNGGLWLVSRVVTPNYRLVAGDFFDIWLETVAYGTESSNYGPIQSEANAWGGYTSGQYTYHTTVSEGTLIADFPTHVRVDGASGQAAFTVRGGNNFVPLEIDGFGSYTTTSHKVPILEELVNNCWVPYDSSVSGNDGWDIIKDPDTGTYGAIFNVWFDGTVSTRTFRASMGKNRLEFESSSSASPTPILQNNIEEGGQYAQAGSAGWLEFSYTLGGSVGKHFTPTIHYRSSSAVTAHFSVDGNAQASFTVPSTGGSWVSMDPPDFLLSAGARTIRLTIDSGSADLDYLQLNFERPVPTAAYDAVCVRHSLPVVLNLGQTNVPGWMTFKNIGTNSWTGVGQFGLYSPALLGGSDAYYSLGSGETVTPGQTRTFNVSFNTPIVTDIYGYHFYATQWYMFYPGYGFGQTWKREIQCTSLAP